MKVVILIAGLVLAGCSRPETFPAGQWEFAAEVTGEEAGGTPVDAAPLPIGDATYRLCITPQQAANPAEAILQRTVPNSCKFRRSIVANGRIDVDGDCIRGGNFAKYRATIDGSFSASGLKAKVVAVQPDAVVMVDPKAGSDLRTTYAVTARRTGDC